jgi:hypothetical protein
MSTVTVCADCQDQCRGAAAAVCAKFRVASFRPDEWQGKLNFDAVRVSRESESGALSVIKLSSLTNSHFIFPIV